MPVEEGAEFVPGDQIDPVVEIDMPGPRDDVYLLGLRRAIVRPCPATDKREHFTFCHESRS